MSKLSDHDFTCGKTEATLLKISLLTDTLCQKIESSNISKFKQPHRCCLVKCKNHIAKSPILTPFMNIVLQHKNYH